MKFFLLFPLLFSVGCATKYIIPGNKFITPESQGGALNSQAEFQQTSANQLQTDASNGSVKDGVVSDVVTRTGMLLSTSIFDSIDLLWSHTGGGNSLLGVKAQVLGASRTAKGAGHKLAFAASFGGNKHEIDGEPQVEFELTGQEYIILYGYRFNEYALLYSNFVYSRYNFSGKISSKYPSIDGLRPKYETNAKAALVGTELSYASFFVKLEGGYQQLRTTYTKLDAHFLYGFSVGLSW